MTTNVLVPKSAAVPRVGLFVRNQVIWNDFYLPHIVYSKIDVPRSETTTLCTLHFFE